jgi:hypothetical protein
VLKQGRVLFQFVRHLIDDETATRRQCIMCFLQERAFLLNLKNAERNTRKDIITGTDAATLQFMWQRRCIAMNHTHTPVASKLALQIARERSVQLEQKQM